MKSKLLIALITSATLVACGGGTPEPAPSNVVLSAIPIGPGIWTVSYPDVQRLADACYPDAKYLTYTNLQPDGRSILLVDGRYVGDLTVLVAALPGCPSPL